MPHCKQCDVELTDFEVTRRVLGTDVYLDLCTLCFIPISDEVRVHERYDLISDADSREDDTPENPDGESLWEHEFLYGESPSVEE